MNARRRIRIIETSEPRSEPGLRHRALSGGIARAGHSHVTADVSVPHTGSSRSSRSLDARSLRAGGLRPRRWGLKSGRLWRCCRCRAFRAASESLALPKSFHWAATLLTPSRVGIAGIVGPLDGDVAPIGRRCKLPPGTGRECYAPLARQLRRLLVLVPQAVPRPTGAVRGRRLTPVGRPVRA